MSNLRKLKENLSRILSKFQLSVYTTTNDKTETSQIYYIPSFILPNLTTDRLIPLLLYSRRYDIVLTT